MRRKFLLIIFFILGIVCLSYVFLFAPALKPIEFTQSVTSSNPVVPASPVTDQLQVMSLEEKIGQLLVAGHWRSDDYIHTSNLVRAYHLGGVIIMSTPSELVSDIPTWTTAWQNETTVPLMISIDQEGGVVSRIKADHYTQVDQPQIEDSKAAMAVAKERGAELQALGINTNFAPVLDTSINPEAFLYDRAFRDPTKIGALGQAMVVGYRAEQVVAVPKHFPGHSDTPTDSHLELPQVLIKATDFAEHVKHFTHVIKFAEPEAIMTAHVMLPALDDVYPATLSPIILTQKLRTEIGYTGVIITDDMTMGAITNTYEPAEAALRAILAGADMILFAAEPNQVIEASTLLLAAVADGRLSLGRIDQSVERILKMKLVY